MESNTYIKREGIGDLPHHETVASYLTTCLRYYDLLLPYTTQSGTCPKENRFFLLTERHFRSPKKPQKKSLMTFEVYLIFLFTAIQMAYKHRKKPYCN